VPGSMDAARRLSAAGLRLGITSNADGTIEDMLRRHEIAQRATPTGRPRLTSDPDPPRDSPHGPPRALIGGPKRRCRCYKSTSLKC
jgi:hypothetical protein